MVTPMVGTKAHQMAIFTLGNGILASTIKAGGGTHFHYTQVIFVLQHLTTRKSESSHRWPGGAGESWKSYRKVRKSFADFFGIFN